jgi:hypothetical protein
MSVQYSDVPAGDTVPFPPAIPQGMLYRVSSAKILIYVLLVRRPLILFYDDMSNMHNMHIMKNMRILCICIL